MTDTNLSIAAIQHACNDSYENNMKSSTELIHAAANKGARLILLQELHTSEYFCQTEELENFHLAESVPGPTTQELARLASELGIVIVGSVFEKRAEGLYHNTAVVLDSDGSLAGIFRKMHIPDDPGYYEKYYFTPGDIGFRPVKTSLGTLGVLVCWDQWFPEAARLMALAGAQLLLYPSAIGWDSRDSDEEKQRQLDAWITVQRSHAIANGLPVICCNRTGHETDPSGITPGIEFWGNSFICGPQGEIIAQGPDDSDSIIQARIDLQRTEEMRQLWPFMRDRRIEAYTDILKRYND